MSARSGRRWHRKPFRIIAAIALVALAVGAAAASSCLAGDCGDDEHRLTKRETDRLPVKQSLANLCPYASTPARERRRLKVQGEALIQALRTTPDATLEITFDYDAEPSQRTEIITVRRLAEISLHEMDVSGPDCEPELAERIEGAL